MTGLRVIRQRAIEDGRAEEPGEDDGIDPAESTWSRSEMLMASVVDELRNLQYMYATSKTKKGTHIKRPEPIRRPGANRKGKDKLSLAQKMQIDPRLRQKAAQSGDRELVMLAQQIARDRANQRASIEDG